MVQQKPVSLHKIIFTITCEGDTLYDAQTRAMNVSAALEDYNLVNDQVTIEMTVEKDAVQLDLISVSIDTVTPVPISWTSNAALDNRCYCAGVYHESKCALSNNT